MAIIKDLTGEQFTNLTVLSLSHVDEAGRSFWNCRCICGKSKAYPRQWLVRLNNPVKSCGCLQYKYKSDRHDWKGYGEISGNWWTSRVERHSRGKGGRGIIEVNIDIKYAWNLFLVQNRKCALSGLSLIISDSPHEGTASLDRINTNLGYIVGNVQWVHRDINYMKRGYSQEYFINLCSAIASYNKD